MRLEELSEGGLGINEESGRDKNEEDVPENVTSSKKIDVKGTQRYFTTLKVQWIKYWKDRKQ